MITSFGIEPVKNDTLNSIALLNWTGNYEVDGCGFIIELNEQEYKAANEDMIDEIFKSFYDPVQVRLEYINLKKKQGYFCGDLPFAIEYYMIEILSIEKL